jgi:hypothetical protein
MRSARQREVAVAVDQAGHDRAAGRVDDLDVSRRRLVVDRPDPHDAVVLDQQADADPQVRAGAVGERGVTVQGARHAATMPRPARRGRTPMWTFVRRRDGGT